MSNLLKKHKIVVAILMIDLFLYWLLLYSGVILPFINPSVELYEIYKNSGTGFPRNTNQYFLWFYLQIPIVLYAFVCTLKYFLDQRES